MPTDDTAPTRLMEMPSWLLSQVSLQAHRLITESLATAGSRGYHYRLLAALDEFGPGSQISLGRRTGIDRSDVAATVDDLVARHFVERIHDADDRRRNIITMTVRGRAHYQRLDRLLVDVQHELLSPLTQSERTQLVQLLRRLIDAAPSG